MDRQNETRLKRMALGNLEKSRPDVFQVYDKSPKLRIILFVL